MRRCLIVAWTGISAAHSIARDLLMPETLYGDLWSHIDMVVSVTGIVQDGKPVLLVGDPLLPGCPPSDDATTWKAELDSLASVIDEQKKFCVIRNPTPCVGRHLLGCNNTIVQTNSNVVLLPVFTGPDWDFSIVDQKNCDIWNGLGFDVVKVPGWMAVYNQNGCIRCATLPLEREPRSS